MTQEPVLIDANEVGRLLGLTARTIRRYAGNGTIPGVVRMGQGPRQILRFNKDAVLRFAQDRDKG